MLTLIIGLPLFVIVCLVLLLLALNGYWPNRSSFKAAPLPPQAGRPVEDEAQRDRRFYAQSLKDPRR